MNDHSTLRAMADVGGFLPEFINEQMEDAAEELGVLPRDLESWKSKMWRTALEVAAWSLEAWTPNGITEFAEQDSYIGESTMTLYSVFGEALAECYIQLGCLAIQLQLTRAYGTDLRDTMKHRPLEPAKIMLRMVN